MYKRITCVLLILLLVLCSACQPTPSQSPVVNKGGDYLGGIEETPFEPYAAEGHADRTAKRNGIRMQFDADVIIPETAAMLFTRPSGQASPRQSIWRL